MSQLSFYEAAALPFGVVRDCLQRAEWESAARFAGDLEAYRSCLAVDAPSLIRIQGSRLCLELSVRVQREVRRLLFSAVEAHPTRATRASPIAISSRPRPGGNLAAASRARHGVDTRMKLRRAHRGAPSWPDDHKGIALK